ncbi:hypothetical protein SIN8267_02563 [Sinobacterium norvegicum]|uniref:Porin n=1 Tax=Sinobacterium norvegicum TaxID=1641715 RepID=A0ABN8EJ27_9GAMM|nr:carbohydrate porin [Sinobacterium norvegicum]CAH0992443.1 hypothetical protein SIN8267_02563 [Sinobacterium norvegicum]
MTYRNCKTAVFVLSLLPAVVIAGQNSSANFGGPDAVENQIAADKKQKQQTVKDQLAEQGVQLAIDYSMLAAGINNTLPGTDDFAAGGMLRFYGSWQVAGDNTGNGGSLIWKVEHRHSYTDIEPRFLEFNGGGVGLQAPPFSDQGGRLTNLYWKQKFNGGKSTFVAGYLDATDYVDVYAVASPWTGFVNFAFSTGNNTMALPGDATLGIAGATMLTDNFYVIGGITDMESDPTKPLDGFDTAFSDGHYFKSLEFGWTSSQEAIYLDKIHLTFWDSDRSDAMNQAADKGVNFSASKMYGQWLPFVRASWADEGSLLGIDKSLSGGFSYYGLGRETDNLGVAVNVSNITYADEDQVTLEAFYLMKFFDSLELTPDLQWVQNPADNPKENNIIVAALRTRIFW